MADKMGIYLQQQKREIAAGNDLRKKEQEKRELERYKKDKINKLKLMALQELERYFIKHYERSGLNVKIEFYNAVLRIDIIEKITDIVTNDDNYYGIIWDYIDNNYNKILNKIDKRYKMDNEYKKYNKVDSEITFKEKIKNRKHPVIRTPKHNPFKILILPFIPILLIYFILKGAMGK